MRQKTETGQYTLMGKKNFNRLQNKTDYMAILTSPLLMATFGILIVGFLALSFLSVA